MDNPILSSTFFLTLLLGVGLFFFIRASVKDRTETVQLLADRPESTLLEQLQTYFTERAYRLASVDSQTNAITFSGVVRPSLALAIFLSVLAGVGLLCLGLVLAILLPQGTIGFLSLGVLAPGAGWFYWKQARRVESVAFTVSPAPPSSEGEGFVVTISAHRDELAVLQQTLKLRALEA
jgi:Cofactor assembly of complex C subunit B